MKVFLAVDLGAGSGRVMAGKSDFSEGHTKSEHEILELEELHRFENNSTELPGGYFWDVLGLYRNIIEGIRAGIDKYGDDVQSIGIDTWGCDYGLISSNGTLLGIPHQYRDPRSQGMSAKIDELVGQEKVYACTGIMSAFYNTSEHLLAQVYKESTALKEAKNLLFIPDLLAYWLTGEKAVEKTIASTSQLFNPLTNDWAWEIIEKLGIPKGIFGRIVEPSTILGNIRPDLAQKIGTETLPVVSAPSHDTASAVAGIPIGSASEKGTDKQDVWISSGTWSIMGVELQSPIQTSEAYAAGFSNEMGVEGSVRFLKNISGLWIIQECRRFWADQGTSYDYGALAELAYEAEPFFAFIDPDHPLFSSPGDMPQKIAEFCRQTGQDVPEKKGTLLRIASESIAMKYRIVFDQLSAALGKNLDKVYMGGGGIQNTMLTQNTADALGREVVAGPVEATSCGNIISQMVATGSLPNITAGRELILQSNQIKNYQPNDHSAWNDQLQRYKALLQNKNLKNLAL